MPNNPTGKPAHSAWKTLANTAFQTGKLAGQVARNAAQTSEQLTAIAAQTFQSTIGNVQRQLGEDYYAILNQNPLVLETLTRVDILAEQPILLTTALNVPWATTLLWSAACGSVASLRHPLGQLTGELFHYGPGHVKRWHEVNQYMDSARGIGHRLKFGHSVDYLPEIVEQFGLEGVPAFFTHLLQDFTTVDGIPTIPHAWDARNSLQILGLSRKAATGLVSVSFSSTLGALAVISLVTTLWQCGESFVEKRRLRQHLNAATSAFQNRDYNAAIQSYQHALKMKRSPYALMALGQAYMQRRATRLRAHQTFVEAVGALADQPNATAPYGQAQLSVRGLASLQALATAEVLAEIHPEFWNDYVRDMVNAAVYSFSSTATKLAQNSNFLVPEAVATPAHFSAAINFYLAAKAACSYPFTEERQEIVTSNLQSALASLEAVARYDDAQLRKPVEQLQQFWTMELLPPAETAHLLAQ